MPVMLIIRDGWGINPNGPGSAGADGNATLLAKTPFHDRLYQEYPWSRLSASGMDVGLPPGQMGNSEVGHLNLGAGRIALMDIMRIDTTVANGTIGDTPVIADIMEKARAAGGRLHLFGLLS